ncbi:ABC transporter ATP-binding protein [Streptomyces sulfonofaciens]|uniref:ABC-type quaternary amine transporter n=1 Tax=Streptomyces sulfonofaciens TaxID=68272 RepID=A0A919L8A1_9ACTN|nr:ABC transporter ATP-binding protein [Streptomyces sulfonofaciens]GHH87627.1 ABC transporter ATP-binding protein [Streptomyces sulfonofaciens]
MSQETTEPRSPAGAHGSPAAGPAGAREPAEAQEIVFDRVVKNYPGAGAPAVDELSLTVPAGEICVLLGPSGSGKTTALMMVNRLTEPTGGDIRIGGRSIRDMDRIELRRSIGYVIQQVGLFPHLSIADNVATVPKVLGWDRGRTKQRVAELLDLVGLPVAEYGRRYPAQLSGGQQQRVGIARALAADPPVMLMDEPFGALDPITRERVQDEFLALHERIRKTVIFVSHDIDEAVKMGTRIAVLREGGHLAQYDTPQALLKEPADEFVARFVGADRGLKRLTLIRLADLELSAPGAEAQEAEPHGARTLPSLPGDASLRSALSLMIADGTGALRVTGPDGRVLGTVTLDAVRKAGAA